jgi:hypothetical protein
MKVTEEFARGYLTSKGTFSFTNGYPYFLLYYNDKVLPVVESLAEYLAAKFDTSYKTQKKNKRFAFTDSKVAYRLARWVKDNIPCRSKSEDIMKVMAWGKERKVK